jgi:hypothetical protein
VKKIILIFFILFLFIGIGIIYLNKVFLPIKISSLIIKTIEESIQKKVALQSVQFNIFRGLVLRDLIIYDDTNTIISLKEGSCSFFILPIFKKRIIIPSIRLKSLAIFLERRKDNTFNLEDLFFRSAQNNKGSAGFMVIFNRVSIREARMIFKDNTFLEPFIKNIENINLDLYLSLPNNVKFNLKSEVEAVPVIRLSACGEFIILRKQLISEISIQDFSPREFALYYQNLGLAINQGLMDSLINLRLKDDILNLDMAVNGKNLFVSKQNLKAQLNLGTKVNLKYSLKEKQTGLSGAIDVLNANLKLERITQTFEDIRGRIEFNRYGIKWPDLKFKYSGLGYKTQGRLTNLERPNIQLGLYSKDLFINSNFLVDEKLIKLSKFSGRYLNSKFSCFGDIDTTDLADSETNLSGRLNIDLKDIKVHLKKFREELDEIKPQGLMDVEFNLKGYINDIKSCAIQARASSSSLSIFGLKAQELRLNYNQINGIMDIPINLDLYDGRIEANAKMNLNSENLPFWLNADIQSIKIEKLKFDTPLKDKDIKGTLSAQMKINGFSNDISKLSGTGKIFITDGNLWQLNLFKGLGSVLFVKDYFFNIIFNEGSCSFYIQDNYIFTNDLQLKSNVSDLIGQAKVGFDGSIDASLNVHILDEGVPLTGTFKDITTAIIGEAGRFGVIRISGTLREPRYKFQPAVVDIIKGLKDILLGQ